VYVELCRLGTKQNTNTNLKFLSISFDYQLNCRNTDVLWKSAVILLRNQKRYSEKNCKEFSQKRRLYNVSEALQHTVYRDLIIKIWLGLNDLSDDFINCTIEHLRQRLTSVVNYTMPPTTTADHTEQFFNWLNYIAYCCENFAPMTLRIRRLLSVCVCVSCVQNISRSRGGIHGEMFEGVDTRNNLLDFGGDLDHYPDLGFLNPNHDPVLGFLKKFFYLLICHNLGNPQRRFALYRVRYSLF